jgi:photosystem II stability/assembly factor-like uncharacterized protein
MIRQAPQLTWRGWYIALLGLVLALPSAAQQWKVLGPDGGDARSLSYDPRNPDHIFLGTSTGTIFNSIDGGRSWSRLAHLGSDDSYVLDHIAIQRQTPDVIFASAWSVQDQKAGDLFRSQNGGTTWVPLPGMHGKSIRTLSIAPSDPRALVAGTLEGVYRSRDGGDTWEHISSAERGAIKNVESVAIDPVNPDVIYAGTWHLAWKTNDGGQTWAHITRGMIDDSDVFSIIVDASNPSVVFASACSGIYKSSTAGELFQKVQGIPFSARRTRVLKQDPTDPNIVYAGTTEGLWKSSDAGKNWRQMTDPEVVVNDVFVDPRNSKRLLLATDRGGVLASDDQAQTFSPSNHGYTHRYVTAMLVDKNDPGTLIVGVANDRKWGGVFSFRADGQHWQQKSAGLGGRDVFTLKQTPAGALVAGTNQGIFLLNRGGNTWKPINTVVDEHPSSPVARAKTGRSPSPAKPGLYSLSDAKINDIEITPERWLAATSSGLFTSANAGKSWNGGPVLGTKEFISVGYSGKLHVLATHTEILVSTDGGTDWQQATLPSRLTSIRSVTVIPDAQILVASRDGAFRSLDNGKTWEQARNGLPETDISSVTYDEESQRLLATSMGTGVVYESGDGGRSWRSGPDSGYPLRRVSVVLGHLVAVTPFDGIIVQP